MSINNKLLPVPLEYTYPIVMKIHPNSKPFSELIYLPELGKWILSCNLLRFFKIHKIDPIVWKGRWLYKKLVNIGDDNWINLKMQIDYPIVMRHTKDYIINNLKNDINFKCKPSIIVKGDFIEQYHISRSDSKYKFNYSFDDLPDIIDSRTEKVTINVLEINPKTGESYGKYRTSFEKFIIRKQDYYKLTSSTKVSDSTKMSNQEFINKSKEKFGENKFEYLSEYKSMYEELLLKCNDCGSIFKVTPFNHLYSNKFGGCDVCYSKHKHKLKVTLDEFIRRAMNVHGDSYNYDKIISENQYDGMNSSTKLDIFCNKCRKFFKQTASDHVTSGSGCLECAMKLIGDKNKTKTEDIFNRLHDKFGNLYKSNKIEYKNNKTPITLVCPIHGDFSIYVSPSKIDRSCGCPDCNGSSIGSMFVHRWIVENNIDDFIREKVFSGIEGRKSNFVRADFIINYKEVTYWIEYNGKQHYIRNPFFQKTEEDFKDQLKRDSNVRNYCRENNIILLEIPYTYNTYKKVEQLLNRAILGGEDINSIIDYSKLYKI